MADVEVEAAKQLISDIGKQLTAKKTCPNKDFIVKLLRQAASSLPGLKQLTSLRPAIKPLSDSLLKHGLLHHKDKDVRLLVSICFCEIIRILAPNPGFSDKVFRDIFELFLSMFVELADTGSPYFSRRVKLLETVAKLEFCVLMLDMGSEDLVLKMFNTFFSVVRDDHPQILRSAMSSIMSLILKEKVSQMLLDVIFQNLLKEAKDASPAAFQLAVSVIQSCSDSLEPFVCRFLTSCILDRNGVDSELRVCYHEIIFEIFQCAPQMLIAVLPNLTQELQTDQVDVRIKAINFIGRLFAIPGRHIALEYPKLFEEFLNRFSDKSGEVRATTILCAKTFCWTNPSGKESISVLAALEARLLDFDDKVRTHAVSVVCDLARCKHNFVPPYLISKAAERLRDKKVSVRKKALQKLLEVYQDYCSRCSEGIMELNDEFEKIPCGILMLCYDKDCKEFGPQSLEYVLAEDLFPASLSVEERIRHWIFLCSPSAHNKALFKPAHEKALNAILSLKRRLQIEMQSYLALRREEEQNGCEEVEKKIKMSFAKMSTFFPDPVKAEEFFHKLHLVKDTGLFSALEQMLVEVNFGTAQTIRDTFLKKIGDTHPNIEFLQSLSRKCLFNIFCSDHVCCIIGHLSSDTSASKDLKKSSVKLLQIIISAFPSLLRGSEEQFCLLLSEDPFNDDLIQILVKASPHISMNLSDLYPSLESICLEGTRTQSKLAISAIAALTGISGKFIFSELCKTLVDALESGQNIPTVLQSLGCLAQHSISAFEAQANEITRYIIEDIFLVTEVGIEDDRFSVDDNSKCSTSCKLKIFGLKALVKSFLPHQHTRVSYRIDKLLEVISQMLQKGEVSDGTLSCETDKGHIRLAAAKSVLRLSRRWDLHIPPHIFRLTVSIAKDPSSFIRSSFINKTFKLLKKHALPSRYACSFALAAPDSVGNLQEDALKCMEEFIKDYGKEARGHQTSVVGGGVMDDPTYIVTFLVHILAHDTGFPPEDCEDEEIYGQFCSPLVCTLQALINPSFVDGDMNRVSNAISCLQSIFNAIKRAKDAVDSQTTSKLHVLANFGISVLSALKTSGNSMSNTQSVVLLPSSLYKLSLTEESEDITSGFQENTAAKMVRSFESLVSRPGSIRAKRGRKGVEVSSVSDVRNCSVKNCAASVRGGNRNAFKEKTHESQKHEVNSRGRQKHDLPSGEISNNEHGGDASGNSGSIAGSEQLPSSCGSVPKKEITISVSLRKNDTITRCESSTNTQIGKTNKALIGQRIKLWSPIKKCYCSGIVHGFNPRNCTYEIAYDSGETEVLCLESERWETLSHGLLEEKESSCPQSPSCDFGLHLSDSSPVEMVDAARDDASLLIQNLPNKGETDVLSRKLPLAVKEKKGHRVPVDTSASEIVDTKVDCIARRTRRRKV